MDEASLALLGLAASSAVVAVYTAALVRGLRRGRKGSRVVSRLRCPRCGYSVQRGWEEGDFVGRVVETRCPRCGAYLVVEAVYVEKGVDLSARLYAKRRETHK